MRSFRRVLSTSVTALAFTAAGLATATPAAAGPGEGCAGLPEMPAAYVCVVQLNPGALVPKVGTTPVPVRVPPVCYIAGCTQPTVVDVPVPNVTPGSGNVAVLYYNGVYYPIGIGLDVIGPLVEDIQILAGNVVGMINGTLEDLPSADEILLALQGIVDPIVAGFVASIEEQLAELANLVEQIREGLPGAVDRLRDRIADIVADITQNICIKC